MLAVKTKLPVISITDLHVVIETGLEKWYMPLHQEGYCPQVKDNAIDTELEAISVELISK